MIKPNPSSVLIFCPDRECGHRIGLFLLTQLVKNIDVVASEDDAVEHFRQKQHSVIILHDPNAVPVLIAMVRALKNKRLKSAICILPTRHGELVEPKWRKMVCAAIDPHRKRKKSKRKLPKDRFEWRHQP